MQEATSPLEHNPHPHHITGPRTYIAVLAALLVLTVITVGASYIHFGSGALNVVIALSIATVKAALVGLFFMHLRHDSPLNAVIFCSSIAFLGLLLGLTFIDSASRANVRPVSEFMTGEAPSGNEPIGRDGQPIQVQQQTPRETRELPRPGSLEADPNIHPIGVPAPPQAAPVTQPGVRETGVPPPQGSPGAGSAPTQ
jgi:cytochrome c oxidase subunit IV